MKRLYALLVALASVVLVLAGCSSSGGGAKTSGPAASPSPAASGSAGGAALSGTVKVDAAASLTEAFTALGAQFEKAHAGTTVKFNFGASSDLATQITQGDSVDVFASAAPANMDTVVKAGLAGYPTNFASNTAEIATPPKNPANITRVEDLAKSGVKVAVCAPKVPCGVVATEVFKNANITVKPTATAENVKATLALVESGEVDAGVVYVTDVKAAGTKVHGVVIPDDVNASTEYPIAALTKSKNPTLAKAWVDYVLAADGTKVLTAAGFNKP